MSSETEVISENQGLYTRFLCGHCSSFFDVEGDVKGELVMCDYCGQESMGE